MATLTLKMKPRTYDPTYIKINLLENKLLQKKYIGLVEKDQLIMFYYGKSEKTKEYINKIKGHYKRYYNISKRVKFFDVKLADVFELDDKVFKYSNIKYYENYLNIYYSLQRLKERKVHNDDFLFIFKNIKSNCRSEDFALKCIFEFLFHSEFKGKLNRLFFLLPVFQPK